ncbi:MAG: NADPH-dependent FMN reductase [Micavibrio sp.]
MTQKIAVIVGSVRKDSINKKLADALVKLGQGAFDADYITIDTLPMYDQDLEADRPQAVLDFVEQVKKYDNILIVTPEYNRSIPPLLKNALDWASRPAVGGNAWKDKTIAIAGASPGAIGAALAQQHLRQVLGILGATVMGGELYFTMKPDLIDADGNVANEDTKKFLQGFIGNFAALSGKTAAKAA